MEPDSATVEQESRAERFVEQYLTFTKGEKAGQPFLLQPWQRQVFREIFNTVDERGVRVIRTYYVSVPRKNGKTETAAALALYMLLSEGEPGALIVCAAKSRDQARLVFDAAEVMVLQNPELRSQVKILRRSMEYKGRFLRTLSYDNKIAMGLNPSTVICDELHVWESDAGREFFEALVSAQGARKQPLCFIITTAGSDKNSICWDIDQRAQQLANGDLVDPSFGSYIRRADPDEDWNDPEVWKRANPNYGVSVYPGFLESKAREAQQAPVFTNAFRRFYLNQWTESESKYINDADWDACDFPVDPGELRGRDCYGGLDLSNTTDLSSFVLVFPPREPEERHQVLPFFWLPQENIHPRVQRDHVKYDLWAETGLLFATPGNVIDHRAIVAKILELSEEYHIREVAFDRWGSVQVSTQLQGEGIEMVQMGQGFASMNSPTKQLLGMVLSKQIAHGGHPVLSWNVANLSVETDAAGNLKPSKNSSREKIDGAVALIMALDCCAANRETPELWGFDALYAEEMKENECQ